MPRGANHYSKSMDSEDCGGLVKRPPKEELEKLCLALTANEIAEHYGTKAKRVRDWLYKLNLKAKKENFRPQNTNRIEVVLGSWDAVVEHIKAHDIHEAAEIWNCLEPVLNRWERYYGVRFKRVCRCCNQSLPYEQMRQRAGGRIYQFCNECFERSDRPKVLDYSKTIHRLRVDEEYRDIPVQIRHSWGPAFGGDGWHNAGQLHNARAGQ